MKTITPLRYFPKWAQFKLNQLRYKSVRMRTERCRAAFFPDFSRNGHVHLLALVQANNTNAAAIRDHLTDLASSDDVISQSIRHPPNGGGGRFAMELKELISQSCELRQALKHNLETSTTLVAKLRETFGEIVNLNAQPVRASASVSGNKKHQALLRRDSEHSDLCNSSSFKAESPRGAADLPCSISLTAEGDRSQSAPISAKVIPFLRRRSEMRDAHVVMGTTLRKPVISCQRQPVTDFRENSGMPRPPGLPRFTTLGSRIRWWREHRQRDRKEFAKTVGIPYSTFADLENERASSTKKLRKIAEELNLRLEYLETDEGEPETAASSASTEWPIPGIPRERLEKLTRTERELLAFKLRDILNDIEADRPATRKTG